jgi:hypothetical protein
MTPAEFIARHQSRYIIEQHRHGLMIAADAYPNSLQDLSDALDAFFLRRSEVDAGGGR